MLADSLKIYCLLRGLKSFLGGLAFFLAVMFEICSREASPKIWLSRTMFTFLPSHTLQKPCFVMLDEIHFGGKKV